MKKKKKNLLLFFADGAGGCLSAGKIRFFEPALYYNYPLFTRLMHLLGARLRGVPLAECRFPGPATRDGSGGESERSTQNGRAKTFGGGGGGGGGAHTNSELPQAGFPESGEV